MAAPATSDRHDRLRSHHLLGMAVGLCLLVRLLFLVSYPHDYEELPRDVDMYGRIGANLAAGEGYVLDPGGPPTAKRPPLYPLILAILHRLGLGGGPAPLLMQAAFDAVTCVLLWNLTRVIGGSRRAGAVAVFAWAAYFPGISLVSRLWAEPLNAMLATAALLLFALAWRSGRTWLWVAAGGSLGVAVLGRATMLPAPLLLGAVVLPGRRFRLRRRLAFAVLLCASACVPWLPWLARNALAFRAFVPATTHGAFTIYEGNCALDEDDYLRNVHGPEARAKFRAALAERGMDPRTLGEVERDRLYGIEVRRLLRAHPGLYLKLSALRLLRLWFNLGYGHPPSGRSIAVCVLHALLLGGMIAGLIRRRGTGRAAMMPALLILGFNTLIYAATVAYVRYTFPVIPLLLAVLACAWFPLPRTAKGEPAGEG